MHIYRVVPYGFLVGLAAPIFIYALNRFFPRVKFRLWNTTIFFATMANFFGNISTGYTSAFLGGAVVMFWAYRYRYDVWARWNYILAAAFDAGFNLNMLLIFLFFGAGKIITMPNWWGNEELSSERCFALDE
jgi:MFS family permease